MNRIFLRAGGIEFKSRITNVEATVVQKMHIAVRQEGDVILPALTFFVTFLRQGKKVNRN